MRRAHKVLPVLFLLLAAGCSGAARTTVAPPACRQPPEAVLPRTAGTLTEADSGTFCLPVGGQIAVFLAPPAGVAGGTSGAAVGADRWSGVVSSAPQVLTATSTGVLTAPLGVTPGIFRGTAAGEARLASSTATGRSWQVTIVIA
ncbi:hypothetical protein [Kitasatospora sp. MAP5-34]|uniref:hypothetical protein n=1 Tax=Kitasatospora sp. MAP5-34 TaxID=3035102 RepID=UPI002475B57B|nr:hypothetical protein [Kitasatospora sp. MAP5-34]MDH6580562.1 hypothetical protein [Kitasatospora sp. MAP5-34]